MGHEKAEKQVVKVIKCIYPEPGILILSGVPFDFYLINLFQTVLDQRTTISSLAPSRGDEIDVTPIFFSIHEGFRAF